MFVWNPFPFVRLLLALVGGILIGVYFSWGSLFHTYGWHALGVLVVLAAWSKWGRIRNKPEWAGNLALLIVLLAGVVRYQQYDATNDSGHLLYHQEEISGYMAEVVSGYTDKTKYYIYEVEVKAVQADSGVVPRVGKVFLYIRKEGLTAPPLLYGDRIALRKKPFRLPSPKNPHEFDYSKYMAGKNVYFQQFVDAEEIQLLSRGHGWVVMAEALRVRYAFGKVIDSKVRGETERAIANALILGIRDGLDPDTKRIYAASGAMHVLAVSGLHVGIIIWVINFLLRPVASTAYGRYMGVLVSLVLLWAFAFVTGLSPSILRAVTMYTVVLLGRLSDSRPTIYNSLAISAFILLFFNPNFLFSVGFQLSYIAVLGIVYVYPHLYRVLEFRYGLADRIWSITCISIAAQLATFPLSLYYFHQFPVYFLISNLVVIPAAGLIMGMGLGLLALGETFLSDWVGEGLHYVIWLLNWFVGRIEKFQWSLIDWLYLSAEQTLLIYLMIVMWCALFYYRKIRFAYGLAVLAMVVAITGSVSVWHQHKQRRLVFYEIGGEAVFDHIEGLRATLVPVKPIQNEELIHFQAGPNRLNNHLPPVRGSVVGELQQSRYAGIRYYMWKGIRFLFISEPIDSLEFKAPVDADYLVVSNNARISSDMLQEGIRCKTIIVDSSNDYQTCRQVKKVAQMSGINCRVLRDEGALTIRL